LCIQYAAVVAKLHQTNAENQRLRELIDRLRIDHNALEEHIKQLKQKQNKHEVVLFFLSKKNQLVPPDLITDIK